MSPLSPPFHILSLPAQTNFNGGMDMEKKRNPRDAQNPIGPMGKQRNSDIAGLNDDTRVVYSEENDRSDGD